MFDPYGDHRSREPQLPAWLAHDLGIHPSTSLGKLERWSPWRGINRFVRSARDSRAEDAMATIPLFQGLSMKQRRLASRLSTTVAVPAGATLTKEGAAGREFFVVLDGQVEVSRGGRVIATRGPGSPLGQTALLERAPSTATLRAKTPLSTMVSGRREFESLLIAAPQITERLRAITAQRRAA